MRPRPSVILLAFLLLTLTACGPRAVPTELLAPSAQQLKLRSFQTRSFEVKDRQEAVRAVIAALQDLGFIVERANGPLGLVTAGKFAEPSYVDLIELTVTVRPKTQTQMEFRVNAVFNTKPIEDPKVYQNFFTVLQRALFANPQG
ncbi:conserved exported hypothetical protein [Nitrospina gracilis 3/211]|uniref:Lipoprotein n=1 Tax=Nitrospina gracilis (strain 3/211) TaxID=1266370 RepID=M1YYA2_NITG3|nr:MULTISPECIES: hypothetical protein [Nitrospina]MCF8723189.1 peptidoglycan hydrolase-like protein with peptidoglycan-binding domain [Nitrospina sp. Nb-3]CCQ90234.1 conserved exported hypothetical protein [Nitrospina gracilis 3/211]